MSMIVLIILGIIDLISILMMLALVFEFRHMYHKYGSFFRSLSDTTSNTHASVYVWMYVVITLLFSFGATLLYFIHPHWL